MLHQTGVFLRRKILRIRFVVAGLCWIVLFPGTVAWAKVSQQEADRLGRELTPMGGNPTGNSAGTIPPFSGKISGAPRWVDYQGTGHFYPNPYPDEKPLFKITSNNYRQYELYLTDGQIALFRFYPETFYMLIYASKRDARYSDFIYQNTKLNAVSAELVADGNGVIKTFGGIPFPIPQNGEELAFNNQYAPNSYATRGQVAIATVFADGAISMEKRIEDRYFEYFDPKVKRENYSDMAAQVMIYWTEPAREKGKIVLVHEHSNLAQSPRNAWQYLPGNRRVRRAPTISYDYPDGPGGLRTVDDALVFNGSTDRFSWKMEGSRELFIPYNNNELDNPQHSYDELLTTYHLNPKYIRYELHRCWVLLGELRPGMRHIYGKRRLYMDEDSWAGALADNYDRNEVLMRNSMRSMVNLYDLPGMGPRVEIYHDFQKKAYLAVNLVNEEEGPPPVVGGAYWPQDYFSPANLRKLGKR